MKISLIIPAHNESKYIGRCLSSVMRYKGEGVQEIIVIDNASTDTTDDVARSFPGVSVVREEKKGLTHARQRAFVEAKGDILAFIDADTEVPEGWFEQILPEFEADPSLVCLSGPYRYYDVPFLYSALTYLYWVFIALPSYFLFGYMAVGGNFAARKDALTKIGGFDTNVSFYGEDTNIARRLHSVGKVKFKMSFFMRTSGRRFRGDGFIKTGYVYMLNFISEALFKKSVTKEYKDIR